MRKYLINFLMLATIATTSLVFFSCSTDDDENKPDDISSTESGGTTDNSSAKDDNTSSANTINGHEYVDLGLSVKWATCNIGASSPSDYGDYYAWAETRTKTSYNYENCATYGVVLSDISGAYSYDAARANWGGTWRMPTVSEIEELISKCKHTWTSMDGHKGYKVTGTNGNSIFLPAAGYYGNLRVVYSGDYGHYWSSTPYGSDGEIAYKLYFSSAFFTKYQGVNRYLGTSVRPVSY